MPSRPFCSYCAPTRQLNHAQERFHDWLSVILESMAGRLVPSVFLLESQDMVLRGFFRAMRGSGLIALRDIDPTEYMPARTKVVARVAKERGYGLQRFWLGKTPTNFYELSGNGKKVEFEGLPGLHPSISTPIDNKEYVRGLMKRIGAPYPTGNQFRTFEKARAFAREVGYPVVVKPHNGSLSSHTLVNISTDEQLREAVGIVHQIRARFIVEKHIPGHVYRATMVGGKMVACGRRDPPSVVGDGVHTVRELFLARDAERKQMMVSLGYDEAKVPPFPFHLIKADPEYILPVGETLPLTWKVNVVYGAVVVDVTNDVHPDNRALFEKIASETVLPCVALDMMAPDISRSWKDQQCAVIELNSMPAIDLHYPPIVIGDTQDVAGALIDVVLAKG